MSETIHVVGLGNVLMGDDGVGVRAVQRLEAEGGLGPGVALVDGGTAVFDTLSPLGGGKTLIVIDAVEGGGEAGAVYRVPFEALAGSGRGGMALSLHEVGLLESLPLLELAGVRWEEVVVFGVEPGTVSTGETLSAAVEAALPEVAKAVKKELSG